MLKVSLFIILTTLAISLTGCVTTNSSGGSDYSHTGYEDVDVNKIQDPIPKHEPKSKYGNPKSYQVFRKTYYVKDSAHGFKERGHASWYGHPFHGRRTSSGEPYDMYKMTAAHKTVPIPCYMRVTNLETGKSIVVRVNDRGPFHDGRVIDLSYVAAKKLGVHAKGTLPVEIEVITPEHDPGTRVQTVQASPRTTPQSVPVVDRSTVFLSQNGDVLLQVAAFSDQQRAQEMVTRLQQLPNSPGARVESGQSNNAPIYRVYVGPFSHTNHAQQYRLHIIQTYADTNPVVITR